jgi:hypothetical protein
MLTILRCVLSFKTVVISRNIIVFKIKISRPKKAIRVVHALWYLVPLADIIYMAQAYTAIDYVVTSGSHIFYIGGTKKRMRIDNTGKC